MGLFSGKKPAAQPARPRVSFKVERCQYVSMNTQEQCTSTAVCECYHCGLKLCKYCAYVNKHEDAQGRYQHRYCLDCHFNIEHNKATNFVDVQAIQVDPHYPARHDDVKW